jgi:hypothetical protein
MRASWPLECALAAAGLLIIAPGHALEYFEDFRQPGRPAATAGLEWDYRAELSPVNGWADLIPGNGYAYLSVDRDILDHRHRRRHGPHWPFQKLTFGPVTANHRISLRAKNTAIPGVAAMLFTYRDQDGIDEIDLEIAAQDTESSRPRHRTGPDGGWTDLRLVTYIGADRRRPVPSTMVQTPIRDAAGQRVSHQDGEFHIYTIEWYPHEVRFLVDGVLQKVIPDAVPDRPTRLIFGLRQMPWAGRADWEGAQTMVVDWVRIEPLEQPGRPATSPTTAPIKRFP